MSTCNLESGSYTIKTDTNYPVVPDGGKVIVDGSQTGTPQVFDFVKFNGAPCTYTITPNGATNYVGFTDPEWKIVLGTLNQNWVITLVDGSNNLYTIQPSGSSQGWTNPGAGNQIYLSASYSNWQITKK